MYGEAIHQLIICVTHLVGVAFFLDVFVSFFTGTIDINGCLVPKPFFKRWITGLFLQLLSNPNSSDVMKAFLRITHNVGPARLIRWTEAIISPLLTRIIPILMWRFWGQFVHYQNLGHDVKF